MGVGNAGVGGGAHSGGEEDPSEAQFFLEQDTDGLRPVETRKNRSLTSSTPSFMGLKRQTSSPLLDVKPPVRTLFLCALRACAALTR